MSTKQYKAIVYAIEKNADGSILLRPVTTAASLTIPQIAAAMNVSYQTINSEYQSGRLKGRRIGSCIRVDVEDFVEWEKNTKVQEYECGLGARTLADLVRGRR